MKKALPWIIFCLSFLTNLFLLFLLFDAAVTINYSRMSITHLRERSDLALSIIRIDWIGKDRKLAVDTFGIFQQKGEIVKIGDNDLGIGDIVFNFDNGVISNVHYLN